MFCFAFRESGRNLEEALSVPSSSPSVSEERLPHNARFPLRPRGNLKPAQEFATTVIPATDTPITRIRASNGTYLHDIYIVAINVVRSDFANRIFEWRVLFINFSFECLKFWYSDYTRVVPPVSKRFLGFQLLSTRNRRILREISFAIFKFISEIIGCYLFFKICLYYNQIFVPNYSSAGNPYERSLAQFQI